MSVAPYPEYKDSGVEWVGKLPISWNTKPLKHLAAFINGEAFKPTEWSDEGTPIIRIQNLNGGDDFNYFQGEIDPRYHVRKGDLLFGWSGNRGTSFGPFVWLRDGFYFLNQHIFKVLPNDCDRQWFYWCLKAVTLYVEQQAHGIIGMVHVTKGTLGAIAVPLPTPEEQSAIAAFLDQETSKIDALVAEQERLIALLKEKRQAVISQAVTKGLNPNAPMKDSGIEWLGQVPAHWTITKTSYLFKSAMGQTILAEELVEDGEWPVFSATEGDHYFGRINNPEVRLDAGDIVIPARGNSIGHVKLVKEPSTTTQTTIYCKLRTSEKVLARFAYHYFRGCKEWLFYFTQTAIPQITVREVNSNPTLVPPMLEQAEIADFIEDAQTEFDTLITEATQAIALLRERRAALISAAVTGKIDVRSLAPAKQEAA